jgi:regulator of protease activity HflC (stomatin/prohibitin superfamily)
MLFAFTSCEKETTVQDPSIEGIWKCIEPDEQDQIYIVFNSDKTGIQIEGVVGYKINVGHFLYTYDSEKKVLTITSDDESYDVSVQKLTSTQLVTILGDDDCLTFSRYNGTINDLEELFDIEL